MKKHLFPLCLIAISLVSWLLLWDKLPGSLPSHWGVNGEVDKTSSTLVSFLFSNALLIAMYLMMVILPKIDPFKTNYRNFTKSYYKIMYAIISMFFAISYSILLIGLGVDLDMTKLITVALGALFIILGYSMPKIEQNFFVGIRTPWTISNETVWKKTHALGGKLYFASGVIALVTLFISSDFALFAIIVPAILASIISVIYSYVIHKKISQED